MSGVRPPAVAGRFYPGDADSLRRLVDEFLAAVSVPPGEGPALAYVVPHAGYRYSGRTAAHVYARLRGHPIERVVLIGPAHYSRVRHCAVPLAGAWRTPLGDVPIDAGTARLLVSGGHASADDEPFGSEHSLEVQLPFLQRCLPPEVPVLPVVVGPATVVEVVAALAAVAGPAAVVLCSTDLSHYQSEVVAHQQDARTARAVLDLAPERVGARDACGVFALRGLLGWARRAGLHARLLDMSTSADTTGDASRVVGYGAFAFAEAAKTRQR
jgi:AmmeMemoRadiSam system protein B